MELNTVTLPATGTYTVLVGDCGDTNTGSYLIYAQRTNNPAGAAVLLFGGGISSGPNIDATRTANSGRDDHARQSAAPYPGTFL